MDLTYIDKEQRATDNPQKDMNPIDILEQYYDRNSKAFEILISSIPKTVTEVAMQVKNPWKKSYPISKNMDRIRPTDFENGSKCLKAGTKKIAPERYDDLSHGQYQFTFHMTGLQQRVRPADRFFRQFAKLCGLWQG